MFDREARGSVLFEALVVLIIASPLLAVMVSAVHHSLLLNSKLKLEAESHKNLIKVRALFSEAMHSSETQTVGLNLVKHRSGQIKFTDGTLNPVVHAAPGRAPDSRSDALSVFILEPIYALRVIRREALGSSALFFACLKFDGERLQSFPPKPPMLERETFLGMSVNGLLELSGEIQRWDNSTPGTKCYKLTLRKSKSMIVPENSIIRVHNVTTIVPALRIYTLYLDQEGNLRYLGHRAGENIENQPLLGGIANLRFRLSKPVGLDTTHLSLSIKTQSGDSETLNFIQQIALNNYLNLLLN